MFSGETDNGFHRRDTSSAACSLLLAYREMMVRAAGDRLAIIISSGEVRK